MVVDVVVVGVMVVDVVVLVVVGVVLLVVDDVVMLVVVVFIVIVVVGDIAVVVVVGGILVVLVEVLSSTDPSAEFEFKLIFSSLFAVFIFQSISLELRTYPSFNADFGFGSKPRSL